MRQLGSRATTTTRAQEAERAPATTEEKLVRGVETAVSSMWAASTWRARAQLWRRFTAFVKKNNISSWPPGLQAASFITSATANVAVTSRLTYAKDLAAIMRRLGQPVPLMGMLCTALRADGGTIPTTQAVPASRSQIAFLFNTAVAQHNTTLAFAIWIAWKTCSRWDDILTLQKRHFIYSNGHDTIVIEWGATKSTRLDPYRASGWTVIQEDRNQALIRSLTAIVRALPSMDSFFISDWTTSRFIRWTQSHERTESLTAHSIKRGAVGFLMMMAARGLLHDPRIISVLAKHKDALHEFQSTTLRYAPNKVHTARMLGTQHATRLL